MFYKSLTYLLLICTILVTISCKEVTVTTDEYTANTAELFDIGMPEDTLLTELLDYTQGRPIENVFFHCTATPEGMDIGKDFLDNVWEHNGWRNPGYHGVVLLDGTILWLQPFNKPSNGARGFNYTSLHFAYVGGVDKAFRPKDTRTYEQKLVMKGLAETIKEVYPDVTIRLHNEVSNKACPSFYDVKEIG